MSGADANTAPEPAAPKRSAARMFFKLFLYVFVFLLLLGAATATVGLIIYDHVTRPGVAGAVARITVPAGATGKEVGRILAEQGFIEHERFFWLAIKLDGSHKIIQQGNYALAHGLSPMELLHQLYKGPNVALRPDEIPDDRKVTVPEGLTIAQMAHLFPNPEAFTAAASDPELIRRVGVPAKTLEGFLVPDTYFFEKKPSEREVVDRMVEQWEKNYALLQQEFPETASAKVIEVVTVASLVEEEARVDDERPLVAAVIYNRIARGIPLSLDSTLQYALDKYGQRMIDSDKQVDSPYNTYTRAGLPPGPISNPGLASLRAALRPAKADYLYFVSNADGKTHTFSSTLAEHERAVAQFRQKIRVQRAEEQRGPNGDGRQ